MRTSTNALAPCTYACMHELIHGCASSANEHDTYTDIATMGHNLSIEVDRQVRDS